MSFMFNPFPYDDVSAVNTPLWEEGNTEHVVEGNHQVAQAICSTITALLDEKEQVVMALDGYLSAPFAPLVQLIMRNLLIKGYQEITSINIDTCYKESIQLETLVSPYLPQDTAVDPVLLYGKLYTGDESIYFDKDKKESLLEFLQNPKRPQVVLLYGNFAASEEIRVQCDLVSYIDVIPKNVVLNIKNGVARNVGDSSMRSYRETMRRAYYVDLEVSMKVRSDLLLSGVLNYYIVGNNPDKLQLIPFSMLKKACDALVLQPFRCKPVYNEGVWGGYYTKVYRNLPQEMKNCAWVFDLIPSEVSLMIHIGSHTIDIPFYTFIRLESLPLLGEHSLNRFGPYFPIRFNYDDTFHSSGNMSIQVHPHESYCKEHFTELGRQDESYYIVEAAQGAKTYCGFTETADPKEFIALMKESEKSGSIVDYEKYVNAEVSVVGKQFLIPAGTIHASGRNQLVLEIGSLTVGSYTFKLYDYLRVDFDGKRRPIHSSYGEDVLDLHRTKSYVQTQLCPEPQEIACKDGYRELIVGEHEHIYFSLRRLEFTHTMVQETQGKFHVLCLTDGESVRVSSLEDHRRSFTMNYLDMVVIPAAVGPYILENLGKQPVSIHKTCIK